MIKFCVRLKKSGMETFELLQQAFVEYVTNCANALKWYKQLKNGRKDVLNAPHKERRTSVTEIMVNNAPAILLKDSRIILR